MTEATRETEPTIREKRILDTKLPEWYDRDSPRICLLQLHQDEPSSEETEAKRKELETASAWDHEDYREPEQGAKPAGTDPKADIGVCGIGGCTLRIFQAEDGSDIKTGECKAANYCLAGKFEAVEQAPTVDEGRKLYKDILDTCDSAVSSMSTGHFCPKLDCDFSAGVSVDQVPGTHGTCAVGNLTQPKSSEQ